MMEGRSTGSLEVRDTRFLTLNNLESGKQELAQMQLPIPNHLSTTTPHFRQEFGPVGSCEASVDGRWVFLNNPISE